MSASIAAPELAAEGLRTLASELLRMLFRAAIAHARRGSDSVHSGGDTAHARIGVTVQVGGSAPLRLRAASCRSTGISHWVAAEGRAAPRSMSPQAAAVPREVAAPLTALGRVLWAAGGDGGRKNKEVPQRVDMDRGREQARKGTGQREERRNEKGSTAGKANVVAARLRPRWEKSRGRIREGAAASMETQSRAG